MRNVLILAASLKLALVATSAFSQPMSRDRSDMGRGIWGVAIGPTDTAI